MKKVCKELIEFFQDGESWDKEGVLCEAVSEILKKNGSETIAADELGITDGDKEIMVLSDFAEALFDKILEGVCNVIKTA